MPSVTPGVTFASTTAITHTNLNLAAQPTVTLDTNETYTTTATLGYRTGAGGTVTQQTSKATAFTLNKICGQITTAGDILNAATIVTAVWTNTTIAATDIVVFTHVSGGTVGAYSFNAACSAGSASFTIRNNTAGNLTETLVIGYVVIKGVSS